MAASIGTWSFSHSALETVRRKLETNASSLDAVEAAVSHFEDDPETGVYFVGRGGFPNCQGVLQCDAAIMNGRDLQFGAVGSLEGIATPIKVARRVMDKSPHSFIVGQGAQEFAVAEGFHVEPPVNLLPLQTQDSTHHGPGQPTADILSKSHDTIGIIVLDKFGDISVGVSSSGLKNKYPGRVGDSPLPGCGLYADNMSGAACATGDGDEIMKFCPSFHVVQLMKEQHMSPSLACQQVVQGITDRVKHQSKNGFEIGIIAMNMKGEYGAASTVKSYTDIRTGSSYSGFPYCIWHEGQKEPRLEYLSVANM